MRAVGYEHWMCQVKERKEEREEKKRMIGGQRKIGRELHALKAMNQGRFTHPPTSLNGLYVKFWGQRDLSVVNHLAKDGAKTY